MEKASRSYKVLNAFHLKIIALVTMVTDHIGAIFFPDIFLLRIIGRTAFVLYAFMIAEGVIHTKDIAGYIRKLFVWALISEIPFDLCFYDQFFFFGKQNVFWTLLAAVLGLSAIQSQVRLIIKIIAGLFFMASAAIFRMDYSWYGVMAIYLFYLLRSITVMQYTAINMLGFLVACKIKALSAQIFSFVGLIPIVMYNGRLGRRMGQIYYSFYAIHIALLYVIRKMMDYI